MELIMWVYFPIEYLYRSTGLLLLLFYFIIISEIQILSALNLPDVNSKFRSVTVIAIVDLQTMHSV
jgi:hypothetical protein